MKAATDRTKVSKSEKSVVASKNDKKASRLSNAKSGDSKVLKLNNQRKVSTLKFERKTSERELNRTNEKEDFKKVAKKKIYEDAKIKKMRDDASKKADDYESDFESEEEAKNDEDTKIIGELKSIINDDTIRTSKRREITTQINQTRTNANKNRAKELLDIIALNSVEYELAKIEQIDYQKFMATFGTVNTKQMGLQSVEKRDKEMQTENELNSDEKCIQIPPELSESQANCSSIDELRRLKKFLIKAENILNELIRYDFTEAHEKDLNRFGKLLGLDYRFNQLISFHNYDDSTAFRLSNTLTVFWYRNEIRQVIYSRERLSANLAIENGVYVAGTESGAILVYDLANRDQNKSNLNLPNLNINGINRGKLISSCYSTLFLDENVHRCKIVKLSCLRRQENFSKIIKLISMDESGVMSIWNLENVQNLNLSLDDKLGRGMAPLSKFKLSLRESLELRQILLNNELKLNANFSFETFEKVLNVKNNFDYLLPVSDENLTHQIVHFENNTNFRRSFKLPINWPVLSIKYNDDKKLFLTASSDGTITLFDLNTIKAIYVWPMSGLIKLCWPKSKFYNFFSVLDGKNKILIYDLNRQLDKPIQKFEENSKIVDQVIGSGGDANHLYVGLENGELRKIKIEKLVKAQNSKLIDQLKTISRN